MQRDDIIAEKNRIITAKCNEIREFKLQLAQAQSLAKKEKSEALAANAKSLQKIQALQDELDTERKNNRKTQANYEKVCSENRELRSKFDNLASQLSAALEAKNEEEDEMISVDVIEPLVALYKEKVAELKKANKLNVDCSKQIITTKLNECVPLGKVTYCCTAKVSLFERAFDQSKLA